MNVISKRGLFERAAKHADAKSALQVWFDTAVEAEWKNFEDVRKSFPATDMVGDLAIFNIRGNQYRLHRSHGVPIQEDLHQRVPHPCPV